MSEHPFEAIKQLINSDAEYAWAWQSNLAMPIMDAACVSHQKANEAAALIMMQMFECDITKHPNYAGKKSPHQAYFEARVAAERDDGHA